MATRRLLSVVAGTLWLCAWAGGAATSPRDGPLLTSTHAGPNHLDSRRALADWENDHMSVIDPDELNDFFLNQEDDSDEDDNELINALQKRMSHPSDQGIPNVFVAARGRRVDPGTFYGVRGRRTPPANAFFGARGKKDTPDSDAFFGVRGRRIPPATAFFGARGKKDGPPISFYGSRGKKVPLPSTFFGARGKKDVPISQFFGARGKKDPPPSGFFGVRGKKDIPSSSFYGSRGRRIPSGGFHGVRGKRGPPTGFFGARGRRSDLYDLTDINDSNSLYNDASRDHIESSLDELRNTMEYYMKLHHENRGSPRKSMSSLKLKRQPPSGFNAIRG